MAQVLIGAPLFAQLHGCPLQLSVILLEFCFEPGEQREGVGSRARKTGDDFVIVEAADLSRAGFHDRLIEGNLAIARDCDVIVSAYCKYCCATNPRSLAGAGKLN